MVDFDGTRGFLFFFFLSKEDLGVATEQRKRTGNTARRDESRSDRKLRNWRGLTRVLASKTLFKLRGATKFTLEIAQSLRQCEERDPS